MHPISLPVFAEDATAGRAEMQQAIASLRPRPSLDTYIIEFSVGGIHYRIPRNYLTTMEDWNGGPQSLVTITVNIPDMRPVSRETFTCFAAKSSERPPGCEPFSFRINGAGRPSADEVIERNRNLFHDQTSIVDRFGFEQFEFGPANARTVFYKTIESGRTRLYICDFNDDRDERNGICQAISDSTTTGAIIKFFFSPKHLSDIAQIDANLRKFVESVTIQSGD
jgi:hypothetical protein